MIAAIGIDGTRPVVWGLGVTADAAIAEACEQEPTWDSQGRATCVVSADLVTQIEGGIVDCKTLGITVSVDQRGWIDGAEYQHAGSDYDRSEIAERHYKPETS